MTRHVAVVHQYGLTADKSKDR
eukprot:COSAG02_NODE_41708_length_391_cov_4.167808_1_plen_21_part_01